MRTAQHPGTVSARRMAGILGVAESRIKAAARRGWVPCKWTRGGRAKFDPDGVLDRLEACPELITRVRPRLAGADVLDAAVWAMDALTRGLRWAPALPSSVGLALYFWARRSEANQDMLTQFLLSFGFRRYLLFNGPGPTPEGGESIPDDFRAMMDRLEREGLMFRRRAARRARRSIRRATAEFERTRAVDHFTLVSGDEMSHILGAPIEQLEEMAAGETPASLDAGGSRRYCVEDVLSFVLEHDLPFPPNAGPDDPQAAWDWAADATEGIQRQPTAPNRLAWQIWLRARCTRAGDRKLSSYWLRRLTIQVGASRPRRRLPSLRSLRVG